MPRCPTCEDYFDSQRGLSVHHTRSHGNRIDADEYTESCPTCDESFKTKRGMRMHHSDKHNESISGEPVCCANCGSNKRVKPYKLEKYDRFFCDQDCRSEWRSKNWTGENNPQYNREQKVCEQCGQEYNVKQHKSDKSKFCSEKCQHKWQSKNWRGEDAPAWSGGYEEYYGYSWNTRRKDIQNRDNDICQMCGYDSDETLDVHHIVPVRTFDNPNNAHFDENMCQLCDECHVNLEKLPPIKQKKMLDDAEPDTLERVKEILPEP